jgi:hypothetical protein
MVERKQVKTKVEFGEMTCMGVARWRGPPYEHGNRFCLMLDESNQGVIGPFSVLNMHQENLEEALGRFLEDGKVWITAWLQGERGGWCLIQDGRIPHDWYLNPVIWRGMPSEEIARDILDSIGDGDPHGEIERWIDPDAYWNKRGYTILRGTVAGHDLGDLVILQPS